MNELDLESWARAVEMEFGAWPMALEWPMFGAALVMTKRIEREREEWDRERDELHGMMAMQALEVGGRVAKLRARIAELEAER